MSAGDVEAVARRAAAGDRQAFETLCRTLQPDVWRYCFALTGERELAFEAAQETFVRAVTAIRRFRGDVPVRVYLLVLARRAAAEVLRQQVRHRHQALEGEGAAAPATDHAGGIDTALLLDGLPADLRQAFVLTQLLGLPYEHAATVAGCPVGTIRSRVYRARARLVAAVTGDSEEASDAR